MYFEDLQEAQDVLSELRDVRGNGRLPTREFWKKYPALMRLETCLNDLVRQVDL